MQGMCGAFFRAFKNEEEWRFTYSCSGAESLAQSPQGGEDSGTSPGQGFHCEISMFHLFLQYSPGNSLSMCAQSYAHEVNVNLLITSPLWKRDCLCLTRSYSSYTDDSPTTRTTSYTISSSRPRWNYIIFAGAKIKKHPSFYDLKWYVETRLRSCSHLLSVRSDDFTSDQKRYSYNKSNSR